MPRRIRVVQTIAFAPVQELPFVEWAKKIQYKWWWEIIMLHWGSATVWRFWKDTTSVEEQRRTYKVIVETYCMGGEL